VKVETESLDDSGWSGWQLVMQSTGVRVVDRVVTPDRLPGMKGSPPRRLVFKLDRRGGGGGGEGFVGEP
jgi:hypothetical protein